MDILGRRQETQQWLRCDSRNELGMESRDMLVDIIDMVSKSHQCSSTYAFASIPYDIKKALKCGIFAMNGYLHPPPQHLRCALSEIKSDPTLYRTSPLQAYLQQIQKSTKHHHHHGHEMISFMRQTISTKTTTKLAILVILSNNYPGRLENPLIQSFTTGP